MKKKIIILSTVFSFLFTSFVFAEPIEIQKRPKESQIFITSKKFQPWAVAIGTILIAATGITIVAVNKGKKHS